MCVIAFCIFLSVQTKLGDMFYQYTVTTQTLLRSLKDIRLQYQPLDDTRSNWKEKKIYIYSRTGKKLRGKPVWSLSDVAVVLSFLRSPISLAEI